MQPKQEQVLCFSCAKERHSFFGNGASPSPVDVPASGEMRCNSMSDAVFPWHMHLPRSNTYAKRAEECRWLATVSPPEFRQTYLKLAAEYERLAKQTENTTG